MGNFSVRKGLACIKKKQKKKKNKKKNRYYFLEQFEVQSINEQEVQIIFIYPPWPLNTQLPPLPRFFTRGVPVL